MSSSSLIPYQSKKKPVTQPVVENHTESYKPLDYSFLEIGNLTDLLNEKPRLPMSPRRKGKQRQADQPQDDLKYNGNSLKLHNNNITNLNGFVEVIDKTFVDKQDVKWIDLSQNELTTIGSEITEFKNLKILYLHGNGIADLGQIDQLVHLHRLVKLTLHGNPLETTKNYRSYIVSKLPQLKCLDFSPVTKADRRTSAFLGDKIGKKKKKSEEDED